MAKWPYNTKTWKRLRLEALTANMVTYQHPYPICVDCHAAGLMIEATQVDHIKAHRGDQALAFDRDNLQCLCLSCHSRKTVHEDGGFGKKAGGRTPIIGCDQDGIPLDPEHPWRKEISQG